MVDHGLVGARPRTVSQRMKPVSQQAEKHGADLLVWFEPERVRPGTRLDRERPECCCAQRKTLIGTAC